jgi:hypothetical protein
LAKSVVWSDRVEALVELWWQAQESSAKLVV